MAILTKFGNFLLEKGYLEEGTIHKATEKLFEFGDTSPGALAKILVADLKQSHDVIYEALSKLYAFHSFELVVELLEEEQIKSVKELLDKFPDDFKKKLLYHKIFPFRMTGKMRDILQVLATDVSDKIIAEIPAQTQFKKYEVFWTKLKTVEDLISKIAPQKNEFLQLLEEAGHVLVDDSASDDELTEQALDEEINKSLLVNLFEGALTEAVRRDASDIHIIPANKNTVDVFIRIDGKLQLWHRQENTPPEALSAVVKDRSIGVDRFERDTAQDGFAQRLIDEHLIRFRISIVPLVSAEYERRFESIVIRVVDDRKVITDFRRLGFQEQAEQEF